MKSQRCLVFRPSAASGDKWRDKMFPQATVDSSTCRAVKSYDSELLFPHWLTGQRVQWSGFKLRLLCSQGSRHMPRENTAMHATHKDIHSLLKTQTYFHVLHTGRLCSWNKIIQRPQKRRLAGIQCVDVNTMYSYTRLSCHVMPLT